MASIFLVRPKPFTGESLSSWRQRIGISNGFKIYPLAPAEVKHTDTDLSPSCPTLEWLSKASGQSIEYLETLTLRGLHGKSLRFGCEKMVPKWVIPLHYSRRDVSFGAQYCPICLRSDDEPFFRLSWRLAFSTVCQTHSVRLLDRCSKCGHPAWPGSVALGSLFKAHIPVHICPICTFDLRAAPATPESNQVNSLMTGMCFENLVQLNPEIIVPALEFAESLWVVCQLFLKKRPSVNLAVQDSEEGLIARSLRGFSVRSVEHLSLENRNRVIDAASRLFTSWPDTFVKFCSKHNIKAEHFSESRTVLPTWFNCVVNSHLAKQHRAITNADVESARQFLLSKGEAVTKTTLGRVVGSKYVKVVNDAIGARKTATFQEQIEVIRWLDGYMRKPMPRKSSTEVRVRNVLVVLLSIMTNREFHETFSLCQGDVEAEVLRVTSKDPRDKLQKLSTALLLDAIRRYSKHKATRGHKRPISSKSVYFESFRGKQHPERAARLVLRESMCSLDPVLSRSIQAFQIQ